MLPEIADILLRCNIPIPNDTTILVDDNNVRRVGTECRESSGLSERPSNPDVCRAEMATRSPFRLDVTTVASTPSIIEISAEPTREEKYRIFREYVGSLPLAHRRDTFMQMFDYLYGLNKVDYIIIETGCSRQEGLNWTGDGMSTVLFDFFVLMFGGVFISIDISGDAIECAKRFTSSNVNFICADSVATLAALRCNPSITHIDLLYLDSYDLDWSNPHPSALHHLKELCAVQPLPEGCMLVVDDNSQGRGKGQYIMEYYDAIDVIPVFNSYQIGYIIK